MLVFLFLCLAGAQLVTNDLCDGAKNVTNGDLQAGTMFGVPVPTYTTDSSCLGSTDVYYVYTATCVGKVTIAIASDDGNTVWVGVYTGTSCTGLGSCRYSSSSLDVISETVGSKIYFGVGDSGIATTPLGGSFKFNISCTPQPVALGDTCPHAIPYVGPSLVVSTTNAYPNRQSTGSGCGGEDIFVVYNATCNGDATVTSTPSGNLAVFYYGDCNKIVGSEWQRTCEYDGDVSFPVRANELYYVAVGGDDETEYNISFSCAANSRPVNDECQGALTVTSPSTISFDATEATGGSRSVPSDSCSSFYNDVWFSYNATCNGDLVIQFNDSAYAVAYAGSSCTNVQASDCLSSGNTFEFPVWTGQSYKIALGSYDRVVEANLTCMNRTRPANDKCATAMPTATNTSYTFDQRYATTESYERSLSCDRGLVHDFWYLYQACAGTNTISVSTNGSAGVQVAAFLGCGLEPVACDDASYSLDVVFDVPVAFPILIGLGFADTQAFAQVNFSCMPLPPTDAPTNAPTAPTTAVPTRAPTAPTAPTTAVPTLAPTSANNTNTTSNTTTAPTLSSATTLHLGMASLLGFAMLA